MYLRNKLIAVAVMMSAFGGIVALLADPAQAATAPCGASCVSLSSELYTPLFVTDVLAEGATVGQPIVLSLRSGTNPGEDFHITSQDPVSDFYAAGLVSAAVNSHYGNGGASSTDLLATEYEYSPYGVVSGLCIGVPTAPSNGTSVTLQPCGVSGKTVWIQDTPAAVTVHGRSYVPLINGADTDFTSPYALTALLPGKTPLVTWNLKTLRKTALPNQLWESTAGVLP